MSAPSPPSDYVALISYRHAEPDRAFAAWMLKTIETFRVPRRLRQERGLPRRLGRCFRDEEELAASSDLSAAICDALGRSKWLIVVCSPRTPASQWVNREVEFFGEAGRAQHVLALLIEGEPETSLPPALQALSEPLAADARPRPGLSPAQARRSAGLRILARILGVGYDELRQREQARKQRFWMGASVAAGLLVIAFAVLAAVALRARDEARRERDHARALGLVQAAGEVAGRDPVLSLLLALNAQDLHDDARSRSEVRRALSQLGLRFDERGHDKDVLEVALSPLGDRILARDRERLRLLDMDGREVASLTGEFSDLPMGSRFAPDGSFVIAPQPKGGFVRIARDGTVSARASPPGLEDAECIDIDIAADAIWSLHGRVLIRRGIDLVERMRHELPGGRPTAVLAAPGGEDAYVSLDHGRLIHVAASGEVRDIGEAGFVVEVLRWQSRGRLLLAVGSLAGKRLNLEAPDTWSDVGVDLATAGDGHLARLTQDGALRVEGEDGSLLASIVRPDLRHLVADPAGGAFAASFGEGALLVVRTSGSTVETRVLEGSRPAMLALGRGGTLLAAATERVGAALVDLSQSDLGSFGAASGSPWSPDGSSFLGAEGHVAVVRDRDGRVLWTLSTSAAVLGGAWSADGSRVAAACADGTVWIGMPGDPDGRPVVCQGHTAEVTSATFVPGTSRLLSASVDQTARLWEADGTQVARLRGHVGPVRHLAASHDGSRLLTSDGREGARIWDADGQPLRLAHVGGERVRSMGFFPGTTNIAIVGVKRAGIFDGDGRLATLVQARLEEEIRAAAFTSRGTLALFADRLRIVDAQGREVASLPASANGGAISDAGDRAVVWAGGPTAELLDLVGGSAVPLVGTAGKVMACCFDLAGDRIALATQAGAILFWTGSGTEDMTVPPTGIAVRWLAPSPDGRRLLAADEEGRMRLFVVDPREAWTLAKGRARRDLRYLERVAYSAFLGDPGVDPRPEATRQLVVLMEELARRGLEPDWRARSQEILLKVPALLNELAPHATRLPGPDQLLAIVATVDPDAARQLEASFRVTQQTIETRHRLTSLRTRLEGYRQEHGRYPSEQEGITAVAPAKGALSGRDPLMDDWGNVLRYVPRHDGYDLFSVGADGVAGTPDDIRSQE